MSTMPAAVTHRRYFQCIYAALEEDFFTHAQWTAWADDLIRVATLPQRWVIDLAAFDARHQPSKAREDLLAQMEAGTSDIYSDLRACQASFVYIQHLRTPASEQDASRDNIVEGGGVQHASWESFVEQATTHLVDCLFFLQTMNDENFLRANPWLYELDSTTSVTAAADLVQIPSTR